MKHVAGVLRELLAENEKKKSRKSATKKFLK